MLAYTLLAIALLAMLIVPFEVHADDVEGRANGEISNAQYELQYAGSNVLMKYWSNISVDTQRDATNVSSIANADLQQARNLLSAGLYNESLQEACQSMFLAGQCELQVYLGMASLKIEEANKTISNIPFYLGKPWYAMDILQNATAECEAVNTSSFTEMPYSDNITVLADMIQTQVYQTIEEKAVPQLFSSSDSAYNLAIKSENLAIAFQSEQNGIFWPLVSIAVICPSALLFLIGLIIGTKKAEGIRGRFRKWRMEFKKPLTLENLSGKERSFSLRIVEASGVMVTALFTIGALTGAVMQQVKFVYQFIGYMFEYALPFIFSAICGTFTLYLDKRWKRFPNPFEFTVALFTSGWGSLILLLFLATQYQTIPQNFYYIVPISLMLITFLGSLGVSLVIIYFLRRLGKMSAKYQSLSSLEYE